MATSNEYYGQNDTKEADDVTLGPYIKESCHRLFGAECVFVELRLP